MTEVTPAHQRLWESPRPHPGERPGGHRGHPWDTGTVLGDTGILLGDTGPSLGTQRPLGTQGTSLGTQGPSLGAQGPSLGTHMECPWRHRGHPWGQSDCPWDTGTIGDTGTSLGAQGLSRWAVGCEDRVTQVSPRPQGGGSVPLAGLRGGEPCVGWDRRDSETPQPQSCPQFTPQTHLHGVPHPWQCPGPGWAGLGALQIVPGTGGALRSLPTHPSSAPWDISRVLPVPPGGIRAGRGGRSSIPGPGRALCRSRCCPRGVRVL